MMRAATEESKEERRWQTSSLVSSPCNSTWKQMSSICCSRRPATRTVRSAARAVAMQPKANVTAASVTSGPASSAMAFFRAREARESLLNSSGFGTEIVTWPLATKMAANAGARPKPNPKAMPRAPARLVPTAPATTASGGSLGGSLGLGRITSVVEVVLEDVEDVEEVVLEDVVLEVVLEDVVLEDVVLEDVEELLVELLLEVLVELLLELLVEVVELLLVVDVEDMDDDVLLNVVLVLEIVLDVLEIVLDVLEVPHVSQVHPVSGSSSQPGQSQKSSFLKLNGILHVASHLKTKSSPPGLLERGSIVNKVTRKITSLVSTFISSMVSFLKFLLLSFTSKVPLVFKLRMIPLRTRTGVALSPGTTTSSVYGLSRGSKLKRTCPSRVEKVNCAERSSATTSTRKRTSKWIRSCPLKTTSALPSSLSTTLNLKPGLSRTVSSS